VKHRRLFGELPISDAVRAGVLAVLGVSCVFFFFWGGGGGGFFGGGGGACFYLVNFLFLVFFWSG